MASYYNKGRATLLYNDHPKEDQVISVQSYVDWIAKVCLFLLARYINGD